MSVKLSDTGFVLSKIDITGASVGGENPFAFLKGSIVDLNQTNPIKLGRVLRNSEASVEEIRIVDGTVTTAKSQTASGIKLPELKNTKVVEIKSKSESFFGGQESEVYQCCGSASMNNGLFLKVGPSIGLKPSTTTKPEIILSGACLFGSTGLQAVLQDGTTVSITDSKTVLNQPIESLNISEELSLYEVESSARLAATFRELKLANPEIKKVFFQIPREEYMLYCLAAKLPARAETGNCSVFLKDSDFQKACQAIENRANQIEALMKRLIPSNLEVEFCYVMAPANQFIRNVSNLSEEQVINAITEILCNSYEGATDLFKALPKVKELSKFIYRGEGLAYLLALTSAPNQQGLAVENFAQQTLLKELSNRKPRKFLETRGCQIESIYSYESILPITGEISIPSPVMPCAMGPRLSMPVTFPVVFGKPIPKADFLYFSGIMANQQMQDEICRQYNL